MTSFETFSAEEKALGADEVLVRDWAAHHQTPIHAHPFDARALVVRGEFELTIDGQTRHLRSGDRFELARGIAHAEHYGPEGATFWVARRS